MAAPAAIGAALSRARSLRALTSALAGGYPGRGRRRAGSCCLTSCFGCGACALIAGVLMVSVGGALIAATLSLAGVSSSQPCPSHTSAPCTALTDDVVGAPMNCPKLYVSQGYGDTPWEHPHTGIDIVCPPDTLVIAVADGVFHRALGSPVACLYPVGRTGGLGTYGVLDSGGTTYLYGHLEGFVAADGATVVVCLPIGFEGDFGCAP